MKDRQGWINRGPGGCGTLRAAGVRVSPHRPPLWSDRPASLPGGHGSYLLRTQQLQAHPSAEAHRVIDPGPAAGEEAAVHHPVRSQSVRAAGRRWLDGGRILPRRSRPESRGQRERSPKGPRKQPAQITPTEGVRSAFSFPRMDSSRLMLCWLKSIHCTNSSFFKEKSGKNRHGFFTRSICLSGSRNSQCSPRRGTESHQGSLRLSILRALVSYPGAPHDGPSAAICMYLRGSPAPPSRALGCLAEPALFAVSSFSVLFCWRVAGSL